MSKDFKVITDQQLADGHLIRLHGAIWQHNNTINLGADYGLAYNYRPTDLPLDTPVVADYDATSGDDE